jgi:hypothetical protein
MNQANLIDNLQKDDRSKYINFNKDDKNKAENMKAKMKMFLLNKVKEM